LYVLIQLLHCHIAWHQAEGLVMQFIERIDAIPGNVGVTQQWYDTCSAWTTWQNTYHPPMDDSGV
jgi:Multicopper oxidase